MNTDSFVYGSSGSGGSIGSSGSGSSGSRKCGRMDAGTDTFIITPPKLISTFSAIFFYKKGLVLRGQMVKGPE